MNLLVRYWFEFIKTKETISRGVQIGCGVTAFTYDDALRILTMRLFVNAEIPEITKCIENVDIRTLDQGHVIPNMWSPSERGICYPIFYQYNM